MKRIFTFFMVACSSAAIMAQALSVGTTLTDVYEGNTIAYKITAVDSENKTATAELITTDTDLGSAEKTLTIPETFTYEGYTVTPNSMESDGWLGSAKYGRIVFNSSITSINSRALRYARNLTSVDLKNVTSLGMAVFENSPLTSIDLTKVTDIAGMVCRFSAITSLHIPVATSVLDYGAFASCPNLKTITVEAGNPYVKAVDNMLVNSDGTQLYVINWGSTDSLVVPSGVTSIIQALWNGLEADVYIPAASMVDLKGYSEDCQTRVHVPCDLMAAYLADDGWSKISLVGELFYHVNLVAEHGTIAREAVDGACDQIKLTATADAGYKFEKWDDGETANPRIITVTKDSTITAQFVADVPSALDQVELGTIEVRDGRVYCVSDFRIYDTLGRDVTRMNGNLNGVYVVKVGDKAAKIVVR